MKVAPDTPEIRPPRGYSGEDASRTRSPSDFVQIASFDQGDEFVPFDVREPHGVFVLADPDALVGDFDLWAFGAVRAKGELDRSISTSLIVSH